VPTTAQRDLAHAHHVSYGDVIKGRIETAGAHDVYSFSANPGDVIHVSGEGCDLGNFVVDVVETDGREVTGPSCRPGTGTRLPNGGTYELVINAADGGAGSYQFVLQDGSSASTK
jgi:hypothetical protein